MSTKRTPEQYVEHYLLGAAGSAVAITIATLKLPGHHDYKTVLWSLVAGLVVPALAKLNVVPALNKLLKKLKFSSADTAVVDAAATDLTKTVEKDLTAEVAKNDPAAPSTTGQA